MNPEELAQRFDRQEKLILVLLNESIRMRSELMALSDVLAVVVDKDGKMKWDEVHQRAFRERFRKVLTELQAFDPQAARELMAMIQKRADETEPGRN